MRRALLLFLATAILLSACASLPFAGKPKITTASANQSATARYDSIEFQVELEAQYENPYDARQVRLEGVFAAPDGTTMTVPGFWDGDSAWRVRFTPWQAGAWTVAFTVSDRRGTSDPAQAAFNVTESDLHGWLIPGNRFDPSYSPRYLVHHDGTPFYGLGYCEALNILIDRFDITRGVGLFDNMNAQGANFVVWWPLYSMSPISTSFSDYSAANMNSMDMVVRDAEKKGIFLVFTVWDHPQLRDSSHPWGDGRWNSTNGFNKLGSLDSFFTSAEAWAWQENFYRYIIARWGYSRAIGMWQTVSEIDGTNAYARTDTWHEKVNAYFAANDPYRHPTTASKAGDVDWAAGHLSMDMPQVHIYDFRGGNTDKDAVGAAERIATWTSTMWNRAEKPNWVGEFGVPDNNLYPELYHNAIWAGLAAGAALTPAEWNSGGAWGRMTDAMIADMQRLGRFVSDLPLAQLNPAALEIRPSDPQVRGWGLAGRDGGLIWVQDAAMQGRKIAEVRAYDYLRQGIRLEVSGLTGGTYIITPYDTWQGIYLDGLEITCAEGQACVIPLPAFKWDIALKIERR